MVNTRKKREKTPVDHPKSEESGNEEVAKDQKSQESSSAQESDVNKESAAESSQPTTEDEGKSEDSSKPALGLRLVPLNLLLKPEIVNPPKKQSPRKARNAKKSTYIELSSEESSDQEQISIPSSSESSEEQNSDEGATRKKRKSTKANSKLNNGNASDIFKEPMSPTKITKSSKNLSVNLNKMPGNVNKLMKSYRVESETSMLSWSESDDFENMIETTKIDRVVLDKKTTNPNPKATTTDESATSQNVVKKRGPKSKSEKSPAKKVKKVAASSSDETGPTRSRSTRHAALNRKKVVDEGTTSSSSEEESESDQIDDAPAKVVK